MKNKTDNKDLQWKQNINLFNSFIRGNNGFTLVELLTVLVIIGIILAITIPNVAKLMYNQNDKKLSALIDSALKASDVYIDDYKRSFVDTYDKYNFQYESLLNVNYVKEEDIHCTGTMQATRKKGNNFTYAAYLMCKDKKGNTIHDNTGDLPEGGVSIMGKFILDYTVKLNNSSGARYNHDYTSQSLYNELSAYDLERPGTSAGISQFKYSYDNKNWVDLSCDQNTGIGSFMLTNTFVGKVYFKAYDMVGNESGVLSYNVKIDKISPSGTMTLSSTNSRYQALQVKARLNAKDNTNGSGVKQMCIQESNNVNNCRWETYQTSKNFTLSGSLDGRKRTVYAWFKDAVGNIARATNSSGSSTEIEYTPYEEGSVTVISSWGACSKVCGGGISIGTAIDKYTSKPIPSKNQTKSCNTFDCCSSTTISGYGSCSKTCGGGVKAVKRVSNYNGQNCTIATETVKCNTQDCCSLVNYPNGYQPVGACNKVCGGGTLTLRNEAYSRYDGRRCSASDLTKTQSCNTHNCCDEGQVAYSNWSAWSNCSKTCGGGTRFRTRTAWNKDDSKISCTTSSNSKLKLREEESCNTQSCEPKFTMYNRSFDLVLPVKENVAIGFNIGHNGISQGTCPGRDSYVDATVITYSNYALTFGAKKRILSGENGLGYLELLGSRLSDNKVIIYGNSGYCSRHLRSGWKTNYNFAKVATVRIDGTTPNLISVKNLEVSIGNPSMTDEQEIMQLGCHDSTNCVASVDGNGNWLYLNNVIMDSSGNITDTSVRFSSSNHGYYVFQDIENKIGEYGLNQSYDLGVSYVYFPGYRPITIEPHYQQTLYYKGVNDGYMNSGDNNPVRMDYSTNKKVVGATRLNNNELLINYWENVGDQNKLYFEILKYDGNNLTEVKKIASTATHRYNLIPIANNAVIGYYYNCTNYTDGRLDDDCYAHNNIGLFTR